LRHQFSKKKIYAGKALIRANLRAFLSKNCKKESAAMGAETVAA